MNFALRVVGAGDRIYRFHQVDGQQPMTDLLAYVASDLKRGASKGQTSNMFTTTPMLIYDEGRSKKPLGRFVNAGHTSMKYSGQVTVEASNMNDLTSNPGGTNGGTIQGTEGEATTVHDMFAVLVDGTSQGLTGWLFFQGTRQTIHVVDKMSLRAKDGRPANTTISLSANDLCLVTVGDVKMELAGRIKQPVADMMLVGFVELLGEEDDLSNDTLLFPWLANNGVGTLRLCRREGMHVHVNLQKRVVSLARFVSTATLEDVQIRLHQKFGSNVQGFVMGHEERQRSGGKPTILTGRAKLASVRLIDVTQDGKNVFLTAVIAADDNEEGGGDSDAEDGAFDEQVVEGSRFNSSTADNRAKVGITQQPPSRHISPRNPDVPDHQLKQGEGPSLRSYKTTASKHNTNYVTNPPAALRQTPISTPTPAPGGGELQLRLTFHANNGASVRAPITVALPSDGQFSVAELKDFLKEQDMVPSAGYRKGAACSVVSGRTVLQDSFLLGQLLDPGTPDDLPAVILHLRIEM